ncbi:MAG: hypothetical protein IJZ29_02480 [Clostridia bacterium]|nr:hypothetical protein [Clostridia bacterium]
MGNIKARSWKGLKWSNKEANTIIVERVINLYDCIIQANKNRQGKVKTKGIDFQILSRFNSLEHFKVGSQSRLWFINLEDVKDLKSIEICGNKNLQEIKLPKNISTLTSLSIVGNNEKADFNADFYIDLIKRSINCENNLQRLKINHHLYFDIMSKLQTEMQDAKFKFLFENLVRWCDYVSGYGYTEKTTEQMRDYENKINCFLYDLDFSKCNSDVEKFAIIYAKFINSFSYDFNKVKGLTANGRKYKKNNNQFAVNLFENYSQREGNAFASVLDINNAFGLFDSNLAVCEGLSKGLIMICKKCGIEAKEQDCVTKEKGLHAFCEIKFASGSLFVDPTYDIARYKDFEIWDKSCLHFDITKMYKHCSNYGQEKQCKLIDKQIMDNALRKFLSVIPVNIIEEDKHLKYANQLSLEKVFTNKIKQNYFNDIIEENSLER